MLCLNDGSRQHSVAGLASNNTIIQYNNNVSDDGGRRTDGGTAATNVKCDDFVDVREGID